MLNATSFRRQSLIGITLITILWTRTAVGNDRQDDQPVLERYGQPRQIATLANRRINESSGLVASRVTRGILWTHNDSGDTARIFAVDFQGNDRGTFHIEGVQAVDWEDIAYFESPGFRGLLIADTGNNPSRREVLNLYLVKEPNLTDPHRVRCIQRVDFRFEDGPHDCEAIAYDNRQNRVLLATKKPAYTKVYELAWPIASGEQVHVARCIATLPIALYVTAMDLSPDSRHLIIGTYVLAYEYDRKLGESWNEAFSRSPRVVRMPTRLQGESLCYGADGSSLYLTSEKPPAPLFEVPRRP